ncbi:MAG: CotH kinase family protein [Bacteroidales bacterium]|nr:CotH kinase family protein [Bacteroidales bacterium]
MIEECGKCVSGSGCVLLFCFLVLFGATARPQVAFSTPGGFYQEAFVLTLSAAEGLEIRYTTDGSTPTVHSLLYERPLELSSQLYSNRDIFLMQDAPDDLWDPPAAVRHAIVLRAAAFDGGGEQVGPVSTHTYLVASLLGRQPQLPAVSIALDYEMLFDADSGIFSITGFDAEDDFNTGNFNQHGREWERLASVEFYELDNSGFAQPLGVRVHGGKTRRQMQKPLKLYARKEYGEKRIECALFDELPYSTFKRLVLKPFSAAWTDAGIQDLLASRIARPLSFVSLASRPVTLFINGEYWGIYYLQEAPDERLIEQVDDVDADDVNIIGSWLGLVENGNNTGFQRLMNFLETADLSDTLQYAQLCAIIDIDDFIDYQLFEAFVANQDWPANNMRCYQHGTSPWRWIFYDGDGCFDNPKMYKPDVMTYQGSDTWPSCAEATLCLRRCLQSPQFVEQFGKRMYELVATVLAYHTTSNYLEQIRAAVAPEVELQSQRFGMPESPRSWRSAMDNVDCFLQQRPGIFCKQMEELVHTPHDSEQHFALFPNPAHGVVNLQGSSSVSGWVRCSIYDSMGRMVKEQSFFLAPQSSVTQIDITALSPGVYTLHLPSVGKNVRLVVYD